MSKKKYKKPLEKTEVHEPKPSYETSLLENMRFTVSTLQQLEERDREHTRRMTHEQRMEYLQKLISITFGNDLSEQAKAFYNGKFTIRKLE